MRKPVFETARTLALGLVAAACIATPAFAGQPTG